MLKPTHHSSSICGLSVYCGFVILRGYWPRLHLQNYLVKSNALEIQMRYVDKLLFIKCLAWYIFYFFIYCVSLELICGWIKLPLYNVPFLTFINVNILTKLKSFTFVSTVSWRFFLNSGNAFFNVTCNLSLVIDKINIHF